jgi:uncharacterized protein (TIGR03790 family)
MPVTVQAYALTWVQPYRVECMSITCAFAFSFNRANCAEGCAVTRLSPYFDSDSRRPKNDLGLRPTVSIAAVRFENARALIDRGLTSSQGEDSTSSPSGRPYLVETDDVARNVRAVGYADAKLLVAGRVPVEIVRAPRLKNRNDVLFYLLARSTYPTWRLTASYPARWVDHLTATGGDLLGQSQMSGLRWLEGGATGSFGTVVEPRNATAKFPSSAP